jgi:CDP-glucose 4,6-dehydratase
MFEQYKNIYANKKVLVTGHTGFKGAWLVKILSMLGANIKGIALEPKTKNDLYHLIDGDKLCNSSIIDIREKDSFVKEVVDFEPEFIFHLAAQPLVRDSYTDPSATFVINAIGTAYLLDALRVHKGKCAAVMITTDKVYHNNEWVYPYRENDRLGGYDPYSASKACAELVIDSYRNSFFNTHSYNEHQKTIAVARAGNVIGGGDWSKNRLIPDIIKALSTGSVIELRNPDAVRPWQHVIEPLSGYLLLGTKLAQSPKDFSKAYNFGPFIQDTLTVQQMTQMAISYWGNGSFELIPDPYKLHEAGLLKLDVTQAVTELKWSPVYNASKAIDETIGWYRSFIEDPTAINDFTEQQIHHYFQKQSQAN